MTIESAVSIRLLETWTEYLAAEEIQHVVWEMPDWRDIVPAHILVTAQKNGGIVLGAFSPTEQMVGLAFGFLGMEGNQLKLCSDLLAVHPEWQGKQIGLRLKLHQREIALQHDIALITWTYDPLLALNASLNIGRLGAIARRYLINAYGEMTDGLNAGLPSDRFEVEWWLNSPRVRQSIERIDESTDVSLRTAHLQATVLHASWETLQQLGAQQIIHVTFDAAGLPQVDHTAEPSGDILLIEIPNDIGAVKSARPELAREWRDRTRQVLQLSFAAGYMVTDIVFASRDGYRRAAYVLMRQALN
jgi:predicted GNAT superfamily acetyltransferase